MFIITGGGTGIGRALALALAKRKHQVLIVGRREQPLQEVASHSPLISAISADVSSPDDRQKIVEHVRDIPSLQGLIHCAGVIRPIILVREIKETDWQSVMSINLNAPLFLTQALLDKLKHGRILHMGSKMADDPVKGLAAYCVSKAALAMLTRCWQLESVAITLASAMPGVVDTDMPHAVIDSSHVDASVRGYLSELKQQQRLLLPETVALFLTWLLLDTDKAVYVSQEWDFSDITHHAHWRLPPNTLPG